MSAEAPDPSRALIALAVHELRTPLTVATGSVRQLLASPSLDPGARALAERALRACAQFDRVLGEMRDWVRLQDAPARARQAALQPALAEAAAAIEAARPGLRAACEVPPGLQVSAIPERLGPILTAVLSAVARPLPARATLQVRCVPSGPWVAVHVGVTDRASPAGTREAAAVGGLGFALPLAQRALEAGGGRLCLALDEQERLAGAVVELPLPEPLAGAGI